MKAIGVFKYGAAANLVSKSVNEPRQPKGRELLVEYGHECSRPKWQRGANFYNIGRVKAISVNPIDVKVRKGIYDDTPDFYDKVPRPFHIIAPEGSGIVLDRGPDVKYFRRGDEIFFGVLPIFQGSSAERVIVTEELAAHKPARFDFAESASLTITYGTAYEAFNDHFKATHGEEAGVLIINGAGGVGSMATQLARNVWKLPVVISTASRPETIEWTKKMGATHVLNHHEDLKEQVDGLKLSVPIRYVLILHSTARYLSVSAEICEPFGKICSVVQSSELNFYGTKFMSKSQSFAWCWLGTRAFHDWSRSAQHEMLEECSRFIDEGKIISHLTTRLPLTRRGLIKAHEAIESNATIGKIALTIDEAGEGDVFC